jgi:alkylation response protein AidB-like acyl-CoA dehydrogenase
MNFELNENQRMIAQMVRDFAEKEIRPYRNQWDDVLVLGIMNMPQR